MDLDSQFNFNGNHKQEDNADANVDANGSFTTHQIDKLLNLNLFQTDFTSDGNTNELLFQQQSSFHMNNNNNNKNNNHQHQHHDEFDLLDPNGLPPSSISVNDESLGRGGDGNDGGNDMIAHDDDDDLTFTGKSGAQATTNDNAHHPSQFTGNNTTPQEIDNWNWLQF